MPRLSSFNSRSLAGDGWLHRSNIVVYSLNSGAPSAVFLFDNQPKAELFAANVVARNVEIYLLNTVNNERFNINLGGVSNIDIPSLSVFEDFFVSGHWYVSIMTLVNVTTTARGTSITQEYSTFDNQSIGQIRWR